MAVDTAMEVKEHSPKVQVRTVQPSGPARRMKQRSDAIGRTSDHRFIQA
jgi:hypothetical protein